MIKYNNSFFSIDDISGALAKIAIVLELLAVFFSDTLFRSAFMQYALVVFGLVFILVAAFLGNWRLHISAQQLLLIVLVILALYGNKSFSSGINESWFLFFPAALLSSVLLSGDREREVHYVVLKVVVVFSLIHAAVTIACWCVPNLYTSVIHPMFFSNVGRIEGEGYQAGLTTHYSNNGMYLALGCMSAFCLYMEKQKRNRLALFIIIMFALLLTGKRAHFGFSILSIIAIYLIWNRKKAFQTSFKIAAVLGVTLLLLLALSFSVPSINLMFERFLLLAQDDTMNGRTGFYDLCISLFQDSPIFGNGWGSYTIKFNQTELGAYYYSLGYIGMDAHNVFLQVLAELGIVGELVFCLSLIVGMVNDARALYNSDDQQRKVFVAASLVLTLFFSMYCMTGNPLYDVRMFIPVLLTSTALPKGFRSKQQKPACSSKLIGINL